MRYQKYFFILLVLVLGCLEEDERITAALDAEDPDMCMDIDDDEQASIWLIFPQ